ncbi:MAG: ArsR/SmtB family transcription factor [Gemmobacter sp.]
MLIITLNASLSALADPPRRQIIAHLAGGEATVLEPVDLFDLTQPTVSAHIKVLERAGLIVRMRVAQTRPCRLTPEGLTSIATWSRPRGGRISVRGRGHRALFAG